MMRFLVPDVMLAWDTTGRSKTQANRSMSPYNEQSMSRGAGKARLAA